MMLNVCETPRKNSPVVSNCKAVSARVEHKSIRSAEHAPWIESLPSNMSERKENRQHRTSHVGHNHMCAMSELSIAGGISLGSRTERNLVVRVEVSAKLRDPRCRRSSWVSLLNIEGQLASYI